MLYGHTFVLGNQAMNVILEHWQVASLGAAPVTIYPDGCRDVIWWQAKGQAPRWRLAALDITARQLHGLATAQIQGFRLRPGAVVDQRLLANLDADCPDGAAGLISEMATVPESLTEILSACTSETALNAGSLARELGVSLRTLQRKTAELTGQGPLFWLRLARLRRAFFLCRKDLPLSEAAYAAGFADQAHFNREARAFYGESPARLLAKPAAVRAILAEGFGAMPEG